MTSSPSPSALRRFDTYTCTGLGRGRRRLLPPHRVDQAIGRDHLAAVQQQHRQQRPHLRRAHRHRPTVLDDLQRPQDPKLDQAHGPPRQRYHRFGPASWRLCARPLAISKPASSAPSPAGRMVSSIGRTGRPRTTGGRAACSPTITSRRPWRSHSPSARSFQPPPPRAGGPDPSGASYTIPQTPVVRITTPASGFDWGDAGIGAAGGLALAMLGVGGGLVISHQRPRRTHPTTGPPT